MARTDALDLGRLKLTSGEGRRLDLEVPVDPFEFGGERYEVAPVLVPVRLDVSRTTGQGYALRLRFAVELYGPCQRCLEGARHGVEVDAREVELPGQGDELDSPYVVNEELDLHGWARDALALALPVQILCRPECAGLCPVCGANQNEDPGHAHDAPPDPRWEKLRELKLDQ
jgi:uncharacterized protein